MSSIRLTAEDLNALLAGEVITRSGGPTLKIHSLLNSKGEKLPGVPGQVSDGYHTFDELYEHRVVLYLALCRGIAYDEMGGDVWRTEYHSDGTKIDGWFLLGIDTEKGKQITYHLPMKYWDKAKFAKKLDRAPEFDGHTSLDVLERIAKL